MYTFDEMKVRLAHLKSISPAGGKTLVDDLRNAIESYSIRDTEFELQVHKTLDKVITDIFHNQLKYEHMELLTPWLNNPKANKPDGYDDVTVLFKGMSVYEEIMTIRDFDFRKAFYTTEKESESENSDSSSSETTTEWHNRYIEDWIARLNEALVYETEGLKSIMRYCADRSYNIEWALIFEELGKNTERHHIKYYAKQIYVTKGYGWLIEAFNLNVYRPSYLAELRKQDDERSE